MNEVEKKEELEEKDITEELMISKEKEAEKKVEILETEEEKKEFAVPDEDHALTELLNLAINYTDEHAKKLRSEGAEIPEVNKALWESFGKPLLNRAFWYYFPSEESIEDPRISLIIGGGITAITVAPALFGIIRHYRSKEEELEELKEKERVKKEVKKAEEEIREEIEKSEEESKLEKRIKYENIIGI